MKIFEFLQGPQGEWSSKRLFGLICLVQAIVLSYTGGGVEVVAVWLATGGAIFGVQAFSKT